MTALPARYSIVAIVLHWLIALAILAMIPLGLWMTHAIETDDQRAIAVAAYKLHKSVGLTILALSLLRLAWRLAHKPPPLAEGMPAWEKTAALATHWAFYGFMIALPLSGWLLISTNWSVQYNRAFDVPTLWFNMFGVPELPLFTGADDAARKAAAETLLDWHYTMALAALALIALHIAAALKHHFVNRDETFAHMAPVTQRFPLLAALIAAIAGALIVTAVALASQPRAHGRNAAAPVAPPIAQIAPPSVVVPAPSAAPAPSTAPTRASATSWRIDQAASKITFSGTAPSGAFTGTFKTWRGDIRFSADDLAHSRAAITIAMDDAQVPDAAGTAMLKQDDWFATEKYPNATFTPASFKSRGGDKYLAEGPLTLRDKTVSIALPFTLTIAGNKAIMRASYDLDRIAFGIGAATGETLVSKTIRVDIVVVATAQ